MANRLKAYEESDW